MGIRIVSASIDALGLVAETVLVDTEKHVVLKDSLRRFGNVSDVAANDQRSLCHGPQCKVGLLFVVGKKPIADLEHVGVVPVTFAGFVCGKGINQEV